MPLKDEERQMCMRIQTLLSPFEVHTPILLQEDTLKEFELEANSLSTDELAFDLRSPIMEVEEFIHVHNEDEEGVLAMMDEEPK